MTGIAQATNGLDSFVIIGALIQLLIYFKHHLSQSFLLLSVTKNQAKAAIRQAASSGSAPPSCHMRPATTAIFFFLGFLALIRS